MKKTYGIEFPFKDSEYGSYLRTTETVEKEIKSNLLHLILTRKGSRYYLPDFGTRLYEFLFHPNSFLTFSKIEEDIIQNVKKYIPKLEIKKIEIINNEDEKEPHSVVVKIEYYFNDGIFNFSNFLIINL